ncbi:MAG: sugar-transfer associated ATP-grasp domain-containing protein [Pseudomonadota bacterium]
MDFLTLARKIAVTTGKSVTRQFYEALLLKYGKHHVGLSEYHEYGIWDPALSENQRQQFIGWRTSQALDHQLNLDFARVLANDKLINYTILHARGMPIPQPVATYSRHGRQIADEPVLTTEAEVRAFIKDTNYPLFVKPISAGYGRGAMGIAGSESARVHLLDGSTIEMDEFLKPFRFAPFQGMLFQQCIEAHPALQVLTGSKAISCVRMICLVADAEPVIHTTFLKIVTANNMLDNFSHGDYGNCLAAIDPATGTITHAIRRMAPDGSIEHHPTTGQRLIGFTLPDWKPALELVKKATAHFPGLRLQNWDVALTDKGPLLVELNTESELAVPQAINHRGLMDQRLQDCLREIENQDRLLLQASLSVQEQRP